jgi:16S rRNA A1518/A1519 N6-dimethyltransferase RsmA/KsgA/DIM1 with predicted DNA glycosylase/AP lyase activity
VALRMASQPGNKQYGILSVLIQAWYDVEYLFTVEPGVFNPPPKVQSAVIRMTRNKVQKLGCNEELFKRIVKTTFNQRRKMLRVSLKQMLPADSPRVFFGINQASGTALNSRVRGIGKLVGKLPVCEHKRLILINNTLFFLQKATEFDTSYQISSYLCIVKRKQ